MGNQTSPRLSEQSVKDLHKIIESLHGILGLTAGILVREFIMPGIKEKISTPTLTPSEEE